MAAKKAPSKKGKRTPTKGGTGSPMPGKNKGLVIGSVAVGGFLLYRHFKGRSSAAATPTSGNSSATGSITPYTPQSPILVPAGESVYDPNSESLLNTPPAPASTTGTTASPASPTATASPLPTYIQLPAAVSTAKTAKKATKRKVSTPKVAKAAGGVAKTLKKTPVAPVHSSSTRKVKKKAA